MKKIIVCICLAFVACIGGQTKVWAAAQTKSVDNDQRLWYDHPATVWLEAVPLGNSRMGAMVFGGTDVEEIQLNEETFWSGGPHNNNSTTSLQHLDEVRNLIFDGKEREAENIINNSIQDIIAILIIPYIQV